MEIDDGNNQAIEEQEEFQRLDRQLEEEAIFPQENDQPTEADVPMDTTGVETHAEHCRDIQREPTHLGPAKHCDAHPQGRSSGDYGKRTTRQANYPRVGKSVQRSKEKIDKFST